MLSFRCSLLRIFGCVILRLSSTCRYTQTESIYYALFNEVTEAKSLLEQVALVCRGRSMYPRCLEAVAKYVKYDLKQLKTDPAILLSARPVDDPLEAIMYMTSVGIPSTVYDTVKSLREARARRLGALQRKLPAIHLWLLWILAFLVLCSFPLLGAGTQYVGGVKLLSVEGVLFGVTTAGIVLTLNIVGELWRPAGGAYNVDNALNIMVRGLEDELQTRMESAKANLSSSSQQSSRDLPASDESLSSDQWQKPADQYFPSPSSFSSLSTTLKSSPVKEQGANVAFVLRWAWNLLRNKR
jgi:Protein of unknown function (DUF4239)